MDILLMYSPHRPSKQHLRRLQKMDARINLTVADSEDEALAAAERADVIFGHRYLRQCLPQAGKLRWVQSTTNGVDRLPCSDLEDRGITLTRFTGSATDVGRHALALALALNRGLRHAWDNQKARRWEKEIPLLPAPARAIVFGTGHVGQAIGRQIQGMGMETTGVKRSLDRMPQDNPFNDLVDRHSWHHAMDIADWCFMALPHTAETNNLIDENALRRLPAHALVVNVGRGETLSLEGLVSVLRDGHLGGAAVDVLPANLEPLPESHFLWDVPRLLITPHVAAYDPTRRSRVEAFVENQLRRFLAQQPLEEVVLP